MRLNWPPSRQLRPTGRGRLSWRTSWSPGRARTPTSRPNCGAGWTRPSRSRPTVGNVSNTIVGGTQHGPVIQGRDFGNLTFNMGTPNKPSE